MRHRNKGNGPMDSGKFKEIRSEFGKTQKEMAQLLGVSLKAIHSYEQGWRTIPYHVERQLLFIIARRNRLDPLHVKPPTTTKHEENQINDLDCSEKKNTKQCWEIMDCPDQRRENCPAWEFNCGEMCWFINGTICSGKPLKDWKTKITFCKACRVFHNVFNKK